MAFKMKGNPMQRNFGIGSPMNKNGDPKKDPEKKQYSKEQTIKEASKVSESKEATTDPKYTKTVKPKTTTYTKEVKPKETTHTKEVKSKPSFGEQVYNVATKALFGPAARFVDVALRGEDSEAWKEQQKRLSIKSASKAGKAAGKAAGKSKK